MRPYLTFILFSICLQSFSQDDKIYFKEYGVKEGLPEEVAFHLTEDDQGFIWIATQNGLVKFDGYDMEVFGVFHQDTSSHFMQLRNLIGGLLKSRDGKLWMGGVISESGLACYDPSNQSFTNFKYHPDSTKIPFPDVLVMLEDANDNIWFMNNSDELDTSIVCRLDQRTQKITHYPYQSKISFGRKINDLLYNARIASFDQDSSVWIMNNTTSTLMRYDYQNDTFETIFEGGETYGDFILPDSLYDLTQSADRLVLGNSGNAILIDPFDRSVIKHYTYPTGENQGNFVSYLDPNNLLWSSSGKYLTIFDLNDGTQQNFEFGKPPLGGDGLITEYILPAHVTETDIYFEIANKGQNTFLRYNYPKKRFFQYDERFNVKDNPVAVANRSLSSFLEDFSGTRWIGKRPNFVKEVRRKLDVTTTFGVEQMQIDSLSSIFEDSKGRMWVSFEGGVMMKAPNQEQFEVYLYKDKGFPFYSPWYFAEDDEGIVWVTSAFSEPKGLAKYDEKTKTFKHLLKETTGHLDFDKARQHFWLTNLDGIFALSKEGEISYQLDKEKTKGFWAYYSYCDSQGNIWFGDPFDNEHGLIKLDTKDSLTIYKRTANDETSLSSNEIRFVIEDNFNTIWVGTDGGLHKHVNGKFERINQYSIGGWSIDANNNLWTSTYSRVGLLSVNPESGRSSSFGEANGMLHNDNLARNRQRNDETSTDKSGRQYLVTARGLSVFDPITKVFSNFGLEDGFIESNRRYSTISLSNGEIWIIGEKGINVINPERLFAKNTIPPKVWITSMAIMDSTYSAPDGEILTKAIDFTDEIKLEYWQKNLGFEFVALHYLSPEDNQYSWKLEGQDDDWSTPSSIRSATYSNLDPGTYTFRVKGSNADGIWNEEGDYITIIIAPPIWLSAGAYVFYLIILGFAVFGVFRIQKARIIKREQERLKDQQLAQAKEIEKAYSELQQTQTQLIHSEKMASLGELTAGIAHEIQNPLNFVNNFSELSEELTIELEEELDKGDIAEAKVISGDLVANLKKINHHGKRASDIVKSMLQHSRTGSGEKELTDINALADEYLRLSYHGLRAKNAGFNADFKLEIDESLPKVNVIPQDMGRVLLNLINNAFHAVKDIENPQVIVATKVTASNQVQITVSDNGSGIPDSIKEKIFQPFFTTKATGEGTGLGLSMSYDIVTKGHGGSIALESKIDQGTTFIISIPTTIAK